MSDTPPPPPGPCFCSWGPRDDVLRKRDSGPALGVLLDTDAPPMPVGVAYGWGPAPHWRGPVATFRPAIGRAEVPGLWVLDRRFVSLEDWRERQAIDEG